MIHGDLSIKSLMEHGTQRKIAAKLGLSEAYVSTVVNGKASTRTERGRKAQRRVRVAVARAIGKRVHELFPDEQAA